MKIINWIGAVAVMLVGLFFVNRVRVHKQRADSFQEKKVALEKEKKSGSLKKATALGKKAQVSMDKAAAAALKSDARIKKLEGRNETSLADRVRDFNNSL